MVDAVFNQLELIVGTRLNHSSVGDHDNPIHVTHGGETVSDNKRGASSHQALERLLNQTFAFRVQGTGASSRIRMATRCALVPRELDAPIAYSCGVTFREGLDKLVRVGLSGSVLDLP